MIVFIPCFISELMVSYNSGQYFSLISAPDSEFYTDQRFIRLTLLPL